MKYAFFFFLLLINFTGFAQDASFGSSGWFLKFPSDTSHPVEGLPDVYQNLRFLEKKGVTLPFSDENEVNAALENRNWTFEKPFYVTDKSHFGEFILDGVDTYAKIYLNGTLILTCDNAFREYRVHLQSFILQGNNVLRIDFESPVLHDLAKAQQTGFLYPADSDSHPWKTSVYTRKPAYHFGWDFAERAVNCRIQNLRIEPERAFEITNVHYVTEEKAGGYRLNTFAEITSRVNANATIDFTLNLTGNTSETFTHSSKIQLKKGVNTVSFSKEYTGVKRWWPNGSGEASLYDARFSCSLGKKTETRPDKIGFRSFSVDQSADEFGQQFRFVINGKPLFAKGFNYIQTDREITEADVKHWKDLGVNTIRIWGGANYGTDRLYSLCDQYGLLIWQDFMFANTLYPGDSSFLESIEKEVDFQVKRLRNHPSLALWCGNNEIEVAWKNWGWQDKYHYSFSDSLRLINDYRKLFKHLIPKALAALDPERFYLSSSPISNWGKEDDFGTGDNHFWGVYHGEMPLEAYNTHVPRFASEYGMQSYAWNTKSHSGTDRSTESAALTHLQHSYKGTGVLKKYQAWYTGPAHDLADFIYKSQVVQAEATRIAIEAHRRNPKCDGSLLWQWNDVDESASWSMVDVFHQPKLAESVLKSAYQPVLLSPLVNADSLSLYLISDPEKSFSGILTLQLYTLTNALLSSENVDISVFPGSTVVLKKHLDSPFFTALSKDSVWLKIELSDLNRQLLSSSQCFFDTLKNVAFPDPEMSYNETCGEVSWKNKCHYLVLELEDGEMLNVPNGVQSIRIRKGVKRIRARAVNQPDIPVKRITGACLPE